MDKAYTPVAGDKFTRTHKGTVYSIEVLEGEGGKVVTRLENYKLSGVKSKHSHETVVPAEGEHVDFKTYSAAATAITGHAVSGYSFWKSAGEECSQTEPAGSEFFGDPETAENTTEGAIDSNTPETAPESPVGQTSGLKNGSGRKSKAQKNQAETEPAPESTPDTAEAVASETDPVEAATTETPETPETQAEPEGEPAQAEDPGTILEAPREVGVFYQAENQAGCSPENSLWFCKVCDGEADQAGTERAGFCYPNGVDPYQCIGGHLQDGAAAPAEQEPVTV